MRNAATVIDGRRGAHGYSLIELMVAIAIGMFLCSGMLAIVLSMRIGFKTQDGLTRMQENARFVLTVMDTTVHNAGYFGDTLHDTVVQAFPATVTANADGTKFSAGQFVSGTTGAAGGSDTLDVRFQGVSGDGLMDCNGNTNASGAKKVFTSTFSVNAAGQLMCAVSTDGGAPSAGAVLVDNVSAMALLFCVDANKDGIVDGYRTAAQVTTAGLWRSVSSVRITLTFKDLVNSTPTTAVNLPKTLQHTINFMNPT
jgi:type IV pilus assembly protein PilW